jgi:arabinofuranosyltransferase
MSKNGRILPALLFFTVGGVLAGHAAYYYPFIADDAFISLRYANRFIQGLGLTWTDGEPVEGYTNFLWVLINAALGALGIDLIIGARSIGFIGALGAIYAVSVTPGNRFRLDPIRLLTGGLLLALSAPLAVWSIGGLEHGFMAGVLVIALIFLLRGLQSPKPFGRDVWV